MPGHQGRVGPDRAVQGNLDPALCVAAPWPVVEEATRDVLDIRGLAKPPFLPWLPEFVWNRLIRPVIARGFAFPDTDTAVTPLKSRIPWAGP